MPLEDEVSMLRSPPYFDTARYPTERFVSTSIQELAPSHYLIHGTLQVRGVVNPQDLDAVMTERHVDTAKHIRWADFVITGTVAAGHQRDRDRIDLQAVIAATELPVRISDVYLAKDPLNTTAKGALVGAMLNM